MTIPAALASLAFITVALVGLSIMHTYATRGFAFGFSSNRPAPELPPFGLRLQRCLQNQTESAAYTVPALAAAFLSGLEGSGIEWAALVMVLGRAAYAPLYLSGISFIRVPAFVMGTLSSLYLILLALKATQG